MGSQLVIILLRLEKAVHEKVEPGLPPAATGPRRLGGTSAMSRNSDQQQMIPPVMNALEPRNVGY